MSPELAGGLDRLLDSIGADVLDALDRLGIPLYLLDRVGVIRWLNGAAVEVLGEVAGHRYVEVLAPQAARRAQQEFTAKLLGTKERSSFPLTVVGPGGRPLSYQVSSVPLLQDGRVVGVFGAACAAPAVAPPGAAGADQLTPRQREVLDLLAQGRTTREIADELGISAETVRNHVRQLLRRLGAHSRLGAVLAVQGVRRDG